MPAPRRRFRIEEGSSFEPRVAMPASEAEAALRHHEFMTEIKALRSLIEPRAGASRESMEQARAQIAEAQAYKSELESIYAAVRQTRQEINTLGSVAFGRFETTNAGGELRAIVSGTQDATQKVLQAAEDIDQSANTLSASLKSAHQQGLAQDIRDRVLQIYEACNFQDIAGQRATKVIETLALLEERVGRMVQIWQAVEQFKPVVLDGAAEGDRRFLNGPKLEGEAGHSSQDDIDTLFGCA